MGEIHGFQLYVNKLLRPDIAEIALSGLIHKHNLL